MSLLLYSGMYGDDYWFTKTGLVIRPFSNCRKCHRRQYWTIPVLSLSVFSRWSLSLIC